MGRIRPFTSHSGGLEVFSQLAVPSVVQQPLGGSHWSGHLDFPQMPSDPQLTGQERGGRNAASLWRLKPRAGQLNEGGRDLPALPARRMEGI